MEEHSITENLEMKLNESAKTFRRNGLGLDWL
jgi:hypothetical protein